MDSIRTAVTVASTLVAVFYFTALFHTLSLRSSLHILIIFITLTICLSTFIHLKSGGLFGIFVHIEEYRLGGLFGFSYIAFFACLAILFTIILIVLFSFSWLYFFVLIVNIFFLLWTDVYSAFLGLLIGIFFIFLITLIKSYSHLNVFLLVVICLLLIFFSAFFKQSSAYEIQFQKLALRQQIWNISLSRISTRPFTGYEKNPFENLYSAEKISTKLYSAHNAYLTHVLKYGIQSLLLLCLFFALNVINVLKHTKFLNKISLSIIVFWFIISFFWGSIFLMRGPLQLFFFISIFAIVLHPDNFVNNFQIKVYRLSFY